MTFTDKLREILTNYLTTDLSQVDSITAINKLIEAGTPKEKDLDTDTETEYWKAIGYNQALKDVKERTR